jgi:hypothetical protein
MQARVVELTAEAPRPLHRARDAVDLRDPLLHAIAKAERANIRSLATPEQTLAELVLKMRLVDVRQR